MKWFAVGIDKHLHSLVELLRLVQIQSGYFDAVLYLEIPILKFLGNHVAVVYQILDILLMVG